MMTMNEIMLKEIKVQPEYMAKCISPLREFINKAPLLGERVIMGGCGDSYFSAMAVSSLFYKYDIPFIPATSQEVEQFITLKETDLIILSSISGGTKRTVNAALKARETGARTIALTCNPNGDLAKISDFEIVFPYEPITRKTPHSLDFIINLMTNILILEKLSGKGIPEIDQISKFVDKIISEEFTVSEKFVNSVTTDSRFFFLGAGGNVGVAMYGAAKFHEAGGITSFYSETENFWHGFNFMIQPEDRIVVFHNPNESMDDEQLLINNLSELTKFIFYVGPNHVKAPYNITIPTEQDIVTPFINTVVAQILCYATANKLGYKVDDIMSIDRIKRTHMTSQTSWFKRQSM
jgi:fructoselysine-6-P-deglycase FrlB-like protein